jgi:membrane-associated phospholipid phosphatase
MDSGKYEVLNARLRADDRKTRLLKAADQVSTGIVYFGYIGLVIYCLIKRRDSLLHVLAVPAAVYLSGSLLRKMINEARPYEVSQVRPLIDKETKGKSFPSRHVFSSAVIALAFFYICRPLGLAMAVLALLVAALRVLTGVHWMRDVVFGLLYGGLIGFLGFFVL